MTINQWKQKRYNFTILFGFTLAEVLITLGIIGIIAAMTIPTLMGNIQDAQCKTAWKRAYSAANQAYTQAINDNGGGFGIYGDPTPNGNAKFSALQSKLKVTQVCNGNTFGNCWATNGVTPDSSTGASQFKLSKQNTLQGFATSDGMFWILFSNWYSLVAVDTNGNKGPNQWGKDALMFYINDTTITPGIPSDLTGNSVNFLTN